MKAGKGQGPEALFVLFCFSFPCSSQTQGQEQLETLLPPPSTSLPNSGWPSPVERGIAEVQRHS